jgi:hypothetical protein
MEDQGWITTRRKTLVARFTNSRHGEENNERKKGKKDEQAFTRRKEARRGEATQEGQTRVHGN